MLKFEGKFKVGEVIKAYDFMPMSNRPDSYIVGRIVDDFNVQHHVQTYKVEIIEHVFAGEIDHDETGTEAWIPHEVPILEYDNRIQKVA